MYKLNFYFWINSDTPNRRAWLPGTIEIYLWAAWTRVYWILLVLVFLRLIINGSCRSTGMMFTRLSINMACILFFMSGMKFTISLWILSYGEISTGFNSETSLITFKNKMFEIITTSQDNAKDWLYFIYLDITYKFNKW